MKISLLKSLVAAFALCLAVPGQAAMTTGDAGSGGEPGVQQEIVTDSLPSPTLSKAVSAPSLCPATF